MSKASEKKRRNLRVARKRWRRVLSERLKARARARLGRDFFKKLPSSPHVRRTENNRIDLYVPEVLCLDTHFDQTVELIRNLRTLALRQRRRVRLVFENVRVIKASALLLLLAEIHRCRIVRGKNLVDGTYPKDLKLERMLTATGFFDVLDVPKRIEVKRTYPMNYIKFLSADRLKEHEARRLRSELFGEKIELQVKPRMRLQTAITEAMLNAVQHAYPVNFQKTTPGRKRWWLGGTYNRKSKDLTVMFCDLGVGIPATVTRLYLEEKIRAVLSLLPGIKISDGQMIAAAMELGRTRTGEQGRGKGLNDLKKFIIYAGAGELKIFSNKGSYTYGADGSEVIGNHQHSIGGTLIRWRVPLSNIAKNWSGEENDDESDD